MKVTLERTALFRSLTHVHRVVERRNTIPILSNVLLRADGDVLQRKATDLDIEVVESVPAESAQAGGTTVPAHMMYDIVKKLPEGASVLLELNPEKSTLAISSGKARFALQVLPEADFPDITAGEMSHRFALPAADLKRLIDKTQFAISTEETRYYLNGIYVHVADTEAGPRLRGVATDGHRLAQLDLDVPDGAAGMPGVIVPRKTVMEVQRLIEDEEALIAIDLSDTKIRFTIGAVVLTSKLIDGTFPDYQRVIPFQNDKQLTVDCSVFKEAVDRVSTVSSERGRAVKLSMANGALELSVNNPESGSANEDIIADYDADPLDIGFNARYLLDVADQLDGSTAVFRLADPGSPTLVRDPGDPEALYVIMPMRV